MADIHADSLIAGRYRLDARLDAGGRAEVWRAVDEELKRPVAVKILVTPEGGDPAFLERFRDESQVEARLKHPNVVEVSDWGHDGDVNYIVMELLTGRTFRQMLDAEGPVPWQKTLSIAMVPRELREPACAGRRHVCARQRHLRSADGFVAVRCAPGRGAEGPPVAGTSRQARCGRP